MAKKKLNSTGTAWKEDGWYGSYGVRVINEAGTEVTRYFDYSATTTKHLRLFGTSVQAIREGLKAGTIRMVTA